MWLRERKHGFNNEPVAQRIPQWSFRELRADAVLGNSSQIIVQSREHLLGRIHPDDPVWKSPVETLSEVHIPQGWVLLQEEGPLPKLVPCVHGSRLCSSPPKTSQLPTMCICYSSLFLRVRHLVLWGAVAWGLWRGCRQRLAEAAGTGQFGWSRRTHVKVAHPLVWNVSACLKPLNMRSAQVCLSELTARQPAPPSAGGPREQRGAVSCSTPQLWKSHAAVSGVLLVTEWS